MSPRYNTAMSTITTPPLPPAFPPEPISRLTVEQYHGMIKIGLLTEDDPVELLEGWLVPKMPKNPPHSVVTSLVYEELRSVVPAGWHLVCQGSLTTDDSEPEPDVGVVRGGLRDYLARHPSPSDMGVVVEVSDSTLARDRGIKKRIYARAGVPVYWIVNLVDAQVEVYTQPTGPVENPDYAPMQVFKRGDAVPVVLHGKEIRKIDVSQILP